MAVAVLAFVAVGGGQALASQVGCGDTITQDTKLDSDLIDCPGDGIVIGADNITLDLNGHTIDGDGVCCEPASGVSNGTPFAASGHDNVTIKGGTIRQFSGGVTVFRARTNVLRSITASDNGAGIAFEDVDDGVIELSRMSGSGGGISVRGSGSNLIRNNWISGNRLGIHMIDRSGDNVVERNTIVDSSETGLALSNIFSGTHRFANNRLSRNQMGMILVEVSGFQIERNSVSRSSVAMLLVEAHDNQIERNVLSHNGMGMDLQTESRNNRIAGNSVVDNSRIGISLVAFPPDNDGNQLIHNVVSRNGEDGILIGSDNVGNLVRENLTNRNGDDGIDVDSPMNTLTRNSANRNGDLGIEAVTGVIDGGGNHAAANGNPLQCVGVACST